MNFINSYMEPAALSPGATELDLTLPDGQYRLTLADSPTSPTRTEIVDAVVVGGTATLTRGVEGTTDQLWPSGSVIYCAITAGTLMSILQRLDALEAGGGGGEVGALRFVAVVDEDPGPPAYIFASFSAIPGFPENDVGEAVAVAIQLFDLPAVLTAYEASTGDDPQDEDYIDLYFGIDGLNPNSDASEISGSIIINGQAITVTSFQIYEFSGSTVFRAYAEMAQGTLPLAAVAAGEISLDLNINGEPLAPA